ncbi:type VI secretion system TssO [Danxiaibacter flavus]|uniref:Type VI secretion system TssO n=1 Tax=Danxiaibacter flavus TaxID=3049108 RepID=A0ABV3ZIA6_9BACT|nr:type VI secretion system TssO [Chitinophagaceae bacterium DXS]
MKPGNHEERKRAFINFLLFFIITVGIILATVFFSFKVPLRENAQLRAEAIRMNNERMILSRFEKKMQETVMMLDSINESGNQVPIIDNQISRNISELTNLISDSLTAKSFYESLVANLDNVQKLKRQLRDANAKEDERAQLKEQIAALKADIDRYRNQAQLNALYRK